MRSASAAAVRLGRARWTRQGALVTIVTTASIMISLFVMSAFSLSPDQQIERDLGRFRVMLTSNQPASPGQLPAAFPQIVEAFSRPASLVIITCPQVSVDILNDSSVYFTEASWQDEPLPRLRRVDGRAPTQPGEVAVSESMARALGIQPISAAAAELAVFSGTAKWMITGVYSDRFSAEWQILAAPGTWAALPPAAGRARLSAIATTRVLTNQAPMASSLEELDLSITADADSIRAKPEKSWLTLSPFAFAVPAALLPFLVGALSLALVRHRIARFAGRATSVGWRPSSAVGICVVCLTFWHLLSGVAGMVLGVLLGSALRRLVEWRLSVPAGPVQHVGWLSAAILGGMLAGLLASSAALYRRVFTARFERDVPPRGARSSPVGSGGRWRRIGAVAALVLGAVAGTGVIGGTPGTRAMLVGLFLLGAIILVSGDLLRLGAGCIRSSSPSTRWATRLMAGSSSPQTASFAALLVALALPLTTATLLYASGSTARAQLLAGVAEGQLGLWGPGGSSQPPDPAVLEALERRGLLDRGQAVRLTFGSVIVDVPSGASGSLLAVGTSAEAERLLGRPFTDAQRAHLNGGGLLTWVPGFVAGDTLRGERYDARPVEFPAADAYLPAPEWAAQGAAVILRDALVRYGVQPEPPGGVVLVGVDDTLDDRAVAALRQAGLDPTSVVGHHPPASIAAPPALIGSALLLAIMMTALTFAVVSSQLTSIRRQLTRLIAIGVDRRFVRRVVALQIGYVWLMAALAAGLVTVVTGRVLASMPNVELGVRWIDILGVLVACFLAMLSACVLAIARIERLSGSGDPVTRVSQ